MKKMLFLIITFCLFIGGVNATEDLAPNSKSAILIEQSTGKVLFEKNSNEKLSPASMTKVMSMLLIMEAIDSGKLSLEDDVLVIEDEDMVDENTVFLGDIVISMERAEAQAEAYGHSKERELGFLAVHSMLHLLGYDHETGKAEETEMFQKQESVLERVGLVRDR